jgi:hypothetical protein
MTCFAPIGCSVRAMQRALPHRVRELIGRFDSSQTMRSGERSAFCCRSNASRGKRVLMLAHLRAP